MTEKDLIKNLAALQSIAPDQNWVKKNRDVLSYQIFNGAEYSETKLSFFDRFSLISKRVLQPTPIAAFIAVFFMVSMVFASRNLTPNDPLYIAKTISEKAQLATTFNEVSKVKLNLEFASQRAVEMEKIAADDQSAADKNQQLESLSASFKKELESARARISKIKPAAPATTEATDEGVVSAGTEKDATGIQIETNDAQKDLFEAEKLFNAKDYNGAAAKLEQIGKQLK